MSMQTGVGPIVVPGAATPMTSPQTWTARGMMQHSQRGGACRQIVGAKQKALG